VKVGKPLKRIEQAVKGKMIAKKVNREPEELRPKGWDPDWAYPYHDPYEDDSCSKGWDGEEEPYSRGWDDRRDGRKSRRRKYRRRYDC
jgi:hypothetical protein